MNHPATQVSFEQLLTGLRKQVDAGFVAEQKLDDTVSLFCYTKTCVYEKQWNDFTILARGLIIDQSIPKINFVFPKFFNFGERLNTLPDEDFEVFEKLDGSLIIAFFYGGEFLCATKGSFTSEQAKWAQVKLNSMNTTYLNPGTTYLFEAIYPQNRIVINYDYEDLVLLAAYEETGEEFSYSALWTLAYDLDCRIAKRIEGHSFADLVELAKTLPPTEEGWVIRFASGLRLKLKGEEYLRLHRAVSRLTPLTVWEMLYAGDDLAAFRRDLPEEFWADFDSLKMLLEKQLEGIYRDVTVAAAVREWWSDKEVGLDLPNLSPIVRSLIFAYRNQKGDIYSGRARRALFNAIRPTGNHLEGYRPSSSVTRIQDSEDG